MAEKTSTISNLKYDPRNARRHTPRGVGQIERSIQRDGFGRSALLASDDTIIAGNATIEAATTAGLEKVRIIETDGSEIIAVKRTDIVAGSPEFTALAIADNRTAEHSDFDPEILQALIDDDLIEPDELWFPEELERLLEDRPSEEQWEAAIASVPGGDKSPYQRMAFMVTDEQAEQIKQALASAKGIGDFANTGNENSNGNALSFVCEMFITEHGR